MGKRKKVIPETESRFFCMKCSLNCPLNFVGKPDCENCDYYGDCRYCGRKETSICERCDFKNGGR